MSLPSSILLTHPVANYPIYQIEHPQFRARVALHGAQIMEWQPAGKRPVLYLSPKAVLRAGKAIRGGVPICWPWFGDHESNHELPAHGFARSRFWTLEEATEHAQGVRLTFTLSDDEETRKLWNHAFALRLQMHIGSELSLSLTMKNTGDEECKITAALHSYLSVGDISQATVKGLEGHAYLDRVGEPTERRQEGDVTFDREVDRDYRTSEAVELQDASLARHILVQGTGNKCSVVWNPWIEKAARLSDLPDEDYQRFLCIETANTWTDEIILPPGASHTLATKITL
jgi:glucose-6-phosphate 1-epimerase